MKRREEFAEIIAKEAAKPIRAARGEVDRTVQTYKFAAEEAKRIYGEHCHLMQHLVQMGVLHTQYETDWGYRGYYTI